MRAVRRLVRSERQCKLRLGDLLVEMIDMHGLRPVGDDKWAGPIYHADEGMVIQVSLVVENEKHATMRGCVLKVVCKSERWTRVD